MTDNPKAACGGYPGYACEDWPHCAHERWFGKQDDDHITGWRLLAIWLGMMTLSGLMLWGLLYGAYKLATGVL